MKKENLFKRMMKFEGKRESEEDILTRLYGETYVKEMQEKEINKQIAKRDKKDKKKGIVPQVEVSSQREYSYVRIMPENGRINQEGITEEQYNDPAVIGYKAKLMKSAYTLQNGEPRFIKVAHRGEYTKEEQEELRKIEQKRKLEDKERE